MGEVYGYSRVSSMDQNEARQFMAMREDSIAEKYIYTDKLSGKDFQRPQYQALLEVLKPGDQLSVYLTPEEHAQIAEFAARAGIPCSKFARLVCTGAGKFHTLPGKTS